MELREKLLRKPEESPATAIANVVGLLTPPASNRKSLDITLIPEQTQVTSTTTDDDHDTDGQL